VRGRHDGHERGHLARGWNCQLSGTSAACRPQTDGGSAIETSWITPRRLDIEAQRRIRVFDPKQPTARVSALIGYTTSITTDSSGSSPFSQVRARALKPSMPSRPREPPAKLLSLIGQPDSMERRSKSCTPICASRFASVWLTTDCARFNFRPAAEKLPSSAAAIRYAIGLGSSRRACIASAMDYIELYRLPDEVPNGHSEAPRTTS